MIKPLITCILFFSAIGAFAQLGTFDGDIRDAQTTDAIAGATVSLQQTSDGFSTAAATGLNGGFRFGRVPAGTYRLTVSMEGYEYFSEELSISGNTQKTFFISPNTHMLDAVQVSRLSRGTDAEARTLERLSPNVINIISARQIELSPDITVANVVQRVSGLSIERNANGDPQYAVVRGMNKRYNNTLVNGIKIPSPDNNNRFVPLDIFPAVFLEKLTVSKSLSADMEADAIGGTIDMIMKSAPSTGRLFEADIQIGGNTMSHDGGFVTYDRSELYKQSPAEYFGPNYEAIPGDFSPLMFTPIKRSVLPDILASASYGDRFVDNKLGVLVGASFQNSYRPGQSYQFNPEPNVGANNALNMNEYINRRTSTQQQRIAFHTKLDYDLSPGHTISLYGGQYLLNEFRVREQYDRDQFTSSDNFPIYPVTRITNNYQSISVADLSGDHQLADEFKLDWNAVYSLAKNELPDDGVFKRLATMENNQYVDEEPYFQDSPNTRAWERNQDQDVSFFLNGTYEPSSISILDKVKVGGLFRSKVRDNFYNYYKYESIIQNIGARGEDWDVFGDLPWSGFTNGYGDGNNSSLVYDAHEQIMAGYVNTNWTFDRLSVQAGVRGEYTIQGYEISPLSAEANATDLTQEQNYFNFFPSVSLKYALNEKTFLKSTYYKGISRPGFFEIVPTQRNRGGGDSFFHERGNPDLRPTIAHNFDLRYELFPTALDQILVGVFYKRLIDPIEFGFVSRTNADGSPRASSTISPQNYGTANNIGVELDYTRYFREFGVRLNYTYTNSSLEATKLLNQQTVDGPNESILVTEKRALQGQSDHIGNVSLLYKNIPKQWDAQVVLNYTGRRLAFVSPFEGADHYMSPMAVLDVSVEKGFGRYVVFLKANNLLDTPYKLTIDRGLTTPDGYQPHQEDPYNMANVREDTYGLSFRLGLRFKL